ncbi:hypothetical protein SSP35_02_03340 [Streptomyces sp. NBRC 110611]|uniref:hypothetical protein n=1 Tax=Streptomyces sp. NBRC 110611 TaxID=1621259 RepID=UPI0008576793|nr:hypothetical protein [Streptomyces sp. NBRC 110611]GAU65965.1 hypothetical protein SSP35_02_03340 [Streptomyces sp. NBRC 110611]
MAGGRYSVSTTVKQDRDGGSGQWLVCAESSSPWDGAVRTGYVVHLLNSYTTAQGS